MLKHSRKYISIITFGLLIRLAFSFWTGHPWDFEAFIRVGYNVAHGLSLFQQRNYYVDGLGQPIFTYVTGLGYLPAWGLYTAFAYKIYQYFSSSPFLYYFLLKLAPILGDFAAAYAIFSLTVIYTGEIPKAKQNFLFFWFCPFVIFISSVWGMFDSIPIFWTLASVLFLWSNRLFWSAVALGIGIYFKVVPIIYLPINLIFINKRRGISQTFYYCLLSLGFPLFMTVIPVIFFGWSFTAVAATVFSQTQRAGDVLTYWNLSVLLNALFPKFITSEALDSLFSFPLVRYMWILGLLGGYLLYFKLQEQENPVEDHNINLLLIGFLLTTICFLLTRTFIPEQFSLYLLPPIVILSSHMPILKYYNRLWIIALTFAFINNYPFVFAYLINPNLWQTFRYLATTPPFSTIRYIARFIIALLFDHYLIKILLKVKNYEEVFEDLNG